MASGLSLNIDTTKSEFQNPMVELRQGDGNYQSLRVTVTSNGEPLLLDGWTISFMGTTAGGHKIVDSDTHVINASNGVFDYTPTKAWGQDIGEFDKAYFKFTKGDEAASGANFRVKVFEAVDLTDEEAGDYISVVDVMIDKIKTDMDNKLADTQTTLTNTQNQANTVQSNVNDLNTNVNELKAQNNNIRTSDNTWTGTNTFNKQIIAPAGVKGAIDNSSLINAPAFQSLQSQVNNSAVGTNLYTDTKNFDNLASWYANGIISWYWEKTTDTYNGLAVMQTTDNWHGLRQYVKVKKGDVLTYSVYVKYTSGTATSKIFWELTNNTEGSYSSATTNVDINVGTPVDITDSWRRVSGTAVATSDGYLSPRIERSDGNTNTLQIAGIKVEKGSVATDWCPAQEDVPSNDAQLVHKTGTETIAGNKTFTGANTFNQPINGTIMRGSILDGYDLNGYKFLGDWVINGANNLVNYPSGASNYGYLHVEYINQTTAIQTLRTADSITYIRLLGGSTPVWSAWQKTAIDGNVVHNTGDETISGAKTFNGNLSVTTGGNNVNIKQSATVEFNSWQGSKMKATRFGNIVSLRYSVIPNNNNTITKNQTSAVVIPAGFRPMEPWNMAVGGVSSGSNILVNPDGTLTSGWQDVQYAGMMTAMYFTADPFPS